MAQSAAQKSFQKIDISDEKKLKEVFSAWDVNKDGGVSLPEIYNVVASVLPEYEQNHPAVERAYKSADTSRDGSISFDEFKYLIKYLQLLQTEYDFCSADLNNDRAMTFSEFSGWMKQRGTKLDDKALKAEFNAIDTNKDGTIIFSEFCHQNAKKRLAQFK